MVGDVEEASSELHWGFTSLESETTPMTTAHAAAAIGVTQRIQFPIKMLSQDGEESVALIPRLTGRLEGSAATTSGTDCDSAARASPAAIRARRLGEGRVGLKLARSFSKSEFMAWRD